MSDNAMRLVTFGSAKEAEDFDRAVALNKVCIWRTGVPQATRIKVDRSVEIGDLRAAPDVREPKRARFMTTANGGRTWSEVSQHEFAELEQACGFNGPGHHENPMRAATAGFGSGSLRGRTEYR